MAGAIQTEVNCRTFLDIACAIFSAATLLSQFILQRSCEIFFEQNKNANIFSIAKRKVLNALVESKHFGVNRKVFPLSTPDVLFTFLLPQSYIGLGDPLRNLYLLLYQN